MIRILFDDAILTGFPSTRYAGYQIRAEEDPKVHDSINHGRISEDYVKIPTMTRPCNL